MRRSKTEIIRRLRLGDLQKIMRARYGHTLPDNDAGREYLHQLLLPISIGLEHERDRSTIRHDMALAARRLRYGAEGSQDLA